MLLRASRAPGASRNRPQTSSRKCRLVVACKAVVGIDLGTTTSAIAVIKDGKPAILKDNLGTALIPSVVAYGKVQIEHITP